MGTEVLRPKNVFTDSLCLLQTTSLHRRMNENLVGRNPSNSGHNKIKNPPKPTKKKPPFAKKPKDDVTKTGLVNGQVTLLRRGESLASIKSRNPISVESKPVDSLAVPKRIFLPTPDVFAGSAIFSSPSPRAVPLPSFLVGSRTKSIRL